MSDKFGSTRSIGMTPDLLRSCLAYTISSSSGDVRKNFEFDSGSLTRERYTAAAVLVPIFDRPQGATILLTQRTEHLRDHAGQVSFPGGLVEVGDSDLTDTALREAEEEVGLMRSQVEILGRLDTYKTGTGYSIAPIIGLVTADVCLQINSFEVAEVFEVPLNYVLDSRNHRRETAVFSGVERRFYVLPFEGRRIWGATAGMLVNLSRKLSGQC